MISLAGTPAAEADYGSVVDQQITFTEFTRLQQVVVDIIDDDFTENSEMFGATLSNVVVLVDGVEQSLAASEASRIIVEPDTASVEILDNDGQFYNKLMVNLYSYVQLGCCNYGTMMCDLTLYTCRECDWIPSDRVQCF